MDSDSDSDEGSWTLKSGRLVGVREIEAEKARFCRACEAGSTHTVRDIMEADLIPDILETMNLRWNHPLKVACQAGHLEVVMYLLTHGRWEYDAARKTDSLLHIAAAHGHVHIVTYLLQHGYRDYINTVGNCRRTPLHCACKHGSLELVKLLLQHGASLDAKGPGETTPLSYACHHGHLEIVKYLQTRGCDLSGKSKGAAGSSSKTSLHWACIGNSEHVELVEYLIEHGADPNEPNRAGFSPLHLAVSKRHPQLVLTLLRHGARVNETNGIGMHAIDTINPYCVQEKGGYSVDTCQTLVTLLRAGSVLPDAHKSYIPPVTKLLCIWAGAHDAELVRMCMIDSLKARDTAAAGFLLQVAPRMWGVSIRCEDLMIYNQSSAEIEETIQLLAGLRCEMPGLRAHAAAAVRNHLYRKGGNLSILPRIALLRTHIPRCTVDALTFTAAMKDLYPKLEFHVGLER